MVGLQEKEEVMGKISRFGLLVSLLVVGALLVAAYPAAVLADSHPIACYGDVELDGAAAPVDTVIAIYIGADTTPSATFEVETAGEYMMDVWADTSRHGETLSYRVNGVPAKKLGPDPGVFGWDIQQVNLEADGGPHIWTFSAAGFFPKHLPDAYTGQLVLSGGLTALLWNGSSGCGE
jgi:hypothetical protein